MRIGVPWDYGGYGKADYASLAAIRKNKQGASLPPRSQIL
jgi:hypothetical protein